MKSLSRMAGLIVKALRKPPHVVARRILDEIHRRVDRWSSDRVQRRVTERIAQLGGEVSVEALWDRCRTGSTLLLPNPGLPFDRTAADNAVQRRLRLLGSDWIQLKSPIDWSRDWKTGISWPQCWAFDIDYVNLDRPSDVKVPWEISRLQWLIPAAQAYASTGEERYAESVRETVELWIGGNPYGRTVNWACTMEVAIRVFTFIALFECCSGSRAWNDAWFRRRFLANLYLHGAFTERYIERSDINGNHFTADASALVAVGLFFRNGAAPRRWGEMGWRELCREMPRQVYQDGVDFEASSAYHRLVLELFALGAIVRRKRGLEVPSWYIDTLSLMASFAAAYTKPDGTAPWWGDADDARALPLGQQAIGDHRHIIHLVRAAFDRPDAYITGGSSAESAWILGLQSPNVATTTVSLESCAFPLGGVYVMRTAWDHIFIDCGRVGLADRGGHGHNDCLSFEAVLAGRRLVVDSGSFVYTASAVERNRFRATAAHNTPGIDGVEINRFIGPHALWTLHYDAVPKVMQWVTGERYDVFVGSHAGYRKLTNPVELTRAIVLDRTHHSVLIEDCFIGEGEHVIEIPLHLDPGVSVERIGEDEVLLQSGDQEFVVGWNSDQSWSVRQEPCLVSPSYGVTNPAFRLVWSRRGALPCALSVLLAPRGYNRDEAISEMRTQYAMLGM